MHQATGAAGVGTGPQCMRMRKAVFASKNAAFFEPRIFGLFCAVCPVKKPPAGHALRPASSLQFPLFARYNTTQPAQLSTNKAKQNKD